MEEAAQYLNVSQDCLRKWDRANKLKPLKTAGRHRRYSTDVLDEFLGVKKKETDETPIVCAIYARVSSNEQKQKGSNNRNKQRLKIAKAFEQLTNQKEAYIHGVANELLTYYDIVFMEDLNVQGMLKNHKLAKAIVEVGFYRFKQVLTDKANNNFKQVIEVGRYYPSSKTCSQCGYKNNKLTLNDREWTCPICGTHHDRDLNAAMNILMEGERIIGSRTTKFTLVDCPTMDERGLPPKK